VLPRMLASVGVVLLAGAGVARAQGPAYAATPPTKGALYTDGQTGRYLLGGKWLYRADPGDVGVASRWWRDSAATGGWSSTQVPNAFNAGRLTISSWNGSIGWYRRDFTAPRGAFAGYVARSARRWIVRFESVNYRTTAWLNGRLIGRHVGANLPFEFDLGAIRPGVNRLVVRVDNRFYPGALPPGPGGGWWNYGGILGEVYLRAAQGADIAETLIRPILSCARGSARSSTRCTARIDEHVLVRNVTDVSQIVRLRGTYGGAALDFGAATLAPHASWSAQASVSIDHPRLWSIDRPALYRATIDLSDAQGRTLGGYVSYSGVRSITVTAGGRLSLNGRLLSLRGVEVREQDLRLGGALDPPHLRRLVSWVKALGATFIRSDSLSPQIEELADRRGLLIWSDIPVSKHVLDQPGWPSQARTLLAHDILANQNHPSILTWSIANELPTPAPAAESAYVAKAAALAHRLDPTRPVAMAVSGWPGVPCQRAYAPLDMIGLNEYFGWYGAGGGATDDRDALSPFLDSLRACYPHKALVVSEFGFDGNRTGPVEERGTYQFQAGAVGYHLAVFASKPWLSGAIYFLLQDAVSFPGYAGGNPFPGPPLNFKGLLDFNGRRKPAWDVVASIYRHTAQIVPSQ
jgi:beta-glucuronidase